MSPQQENRRDEEEETGKLAVRLANAVVLPMVLKSAIELNVIHIIYTSTSGYGDFISPSDIASRIPTKNPDAAVMLDRMLRLLASYDILKCSVSIKENGQVERLYGAAPICKFLVGDGEGGGLGSVGPLFLSQHDEVFMKSWYKLNEVITLEGGFAFNRAYNGMSSFEYSVIDERFSRVFNQGMSNHTALIMNKILDVYKGFEGLNVLVDVGGGIGATLKIITSRYHPHIMGINYDLPHVIAQAPPHPGVEHIGGDMFESVPKGDAIFMKWILHDWSDGHCIKLLKNCWEALPDKGKVIVVESVLPEEPENDVSSHIVVEQDLLMLALTDGGKERTQKEFDALAKKSGFVGCEVVCCAYNSRVLEFHKSA